MSDELNKNTAMKNIKILSIVLITLFLYSCSSTIKLPVSTVVPAADISATQKEDKNGNIKIGLKVEHLASPERLNPPRNTYVLWVYTSKVGNINIGQLSVKNGKTLTFETIVPYKVSEIFITAEDEGNITYPSGVEISRVAFK